MNGNQKLWQRPMLANALSLYAVQGLNYLVPLLLVPYLLRSLGPHSYGAIVFSQALMGYAVVVTDYGFNLTAARDISIVRDDPVAVARIYWIIMGAKLLLFAASTFLLGAIVVAIPALRQSWQVSACCGLLVVGGIAFPQWYFQGLERLKETAVIQALAKVVTALAVIAFVHSPADVLWAACIMSAHQIAGIVAAKLVGKEVAPAIFVRPSFSEIIGALRGGWHMFVGGASVTLYAHTNTFVLGLMCGDQAVALYNVGYKLVSVLQSLANPVIQAVYPRASLLFDRNPEEAWRLVTRIARLLMPLMVVASLLLAIFAPYVVHIVGGAGYAQAVPVTRILCIMPAGITAALLLAQCVMVNNGLTQPLVRIYLGVGLLNLGLLPGLILKFQAIGAAVALVIAEILGPLLMMRTIMKSRAIGEPLVAQR